VTFRARFTDPRVVRRCETHGRSLDPREAYEVVRRRPRPSSAQGRSDRRSSRKSEESSRDGRQRLRRAGDETRRRGARGALRRRLRPCSFKERAVRARRSPHVCSTTRPRANNPFIAINCAVLTEQLLESELSAMRRAPHRRARPAPSRIEARRRWNIFPRRSGRAQTGRFSAKLLRVLEERRFERLANLSGHGGCPLGRGNEPRSALDGARGNVSRGPLPSPRGVSHSPAAAFASAARTYRAAGRVAPCTAFRRRGDARIFAVDDGAKERLRNEPWSGNVREAPQRARAAAMILADGPSSGGALVDRGELLPAERT